MLRAFSIPNACLDADYPVTSIECNSLFLVSRLQLHRRVRLPTFLQMATERPMTELARLRIVGINHIALEVGDIEEALAFYGRLFKFELRGKSVAMAFIDLGDQFIDLQKGRYQSADAGRHFGLVVDDKEAARRTLQSAGVAPIDGHFLDFRDPWGNRIEIVGYDNIQFSKAPNVLRGMGLTHLTKNESAKKELAKKAWRLSRIDYSRKFDWLGR